MCGRGKASGRAQAKAAQAEWELRHLLRIRQVREGVRRVKVKQGAQALPEGVIMRGCILRGHGWGEGAEEVVGSGVCALAEEQPRGLEVRDRGDAVEEYAVIVRNRAQVGRNKGRVAEGGAQHFDALQVRGKARVAPPGGGARGVPDVVAARG